MKPALLNAPATPLAPLRSSSATSAGMAPVTAADSAPCVEAASTMTAMIGSVRLSSDSTAHAAKPNAANSADASTTTRRSWRSPTWPDHGDTAVETPNTASIAPDTHQEEPVDSYSTQIRAVIAAPRPA